MTIRLGIVGDRDDAVVAHRANPLALALAAREVGRAIEARWLPTETIVDDAPLADVDGVWCVPASPYRSMAGALRAIRVARERRIPFLGTCGGFQHALVEYARGVLGWADADHAETNPGGETLVVTPLACALVERRGVIHLAAGSRAAALYGAREVEEGYHCSYGMAPAMRRALSAGPLRVTGADVDGDPRVVELDDHPFFVATLFQPERSALEGRRSALVTGWVRAAAGA